MCRRARRAGVARHARERVPQRRERRPQAVEPRHLARADPHRGDEVVAVPAALRVELGERPAAARERAPEGRVVDAQRRGEVGVRRAELVRRAVRLDYLDAPGAHAAEHG